MKALKKIVLAVLALCLLLCCFPACSSSGSAESDKLIMATNAEFPPFESKSDDGFVGIDIDIMNAVAKKLGKELVVEDMEFDSIIPAITSGKADVGAAGITVTDERKEEVNFSDPYANAIQVIIVREDSTNNGDLTGLKVGVQQGTTGDTFVDWGNFGEVASLERYSKGFEAVQALAQGKIDAVVIDNEPAKVFVEENEGLKILESGSISEEYALALSKNNDALLADINKAIQELKDSGELQQIIDKYIAE